MLSALTGVFINAALIVAGSFFGLFFKKGMSEKLSSAISNALALCVIYIGISGSLKTVTVCGEEVGANVLISVISMALGTLLGCLLNIDGNMNKLGVLAEKKLSKNSNGTFAKGFVNATLLFCIGAMAITGPIESALTGEHGTLIAKSTIDGITAVIFTSAFGIGVMFSSIPILLYEGAIAIAAYYLGASFLSPEMTVALISVGSLLIIGIGLNMLNITKIKVADMLPAVFLAPLLQLLLGGYL